MSLRDAKVTIVVPIYNVEKYLVNCFESLLKQTSNDYVVLAVNDGSQDNGEKIIQEYVDKYPEIIYSINKENGGYGSVLEIATTKINTDYFIVCDPDDTLEENAIAELLYLAKNNDSDISIGAKNYVYENSDKKDYHPSYNSSYVKLKVEKLYSKEEDDFNDLFFIDSSPHSKLYKTSIAKGINFLKHVNYTDSILFFISLLKSNKVIYTDKPLANYLVNRYGNSMTDISPKAIYGQVSVFKEVLRQASEIDNVSNMFYYRMFETYKYLLRESRKTKCDIYEYSKVIDDLGTFAKELKNYNQKIIPLYDKYNKDAFLEKHQDKKLLNSDNFDKVFANIKKKMMKDFSKK